MTRHVLILEQCDDGEQQYRLSMAYLAKYHDLPTCLKNIPATDNGMYNGDAPQRNQHSITPNGKKVI
jgi:hypothetical protein